MLPGFRFLFAAITLSVSILVFGLGAAALLRAAHEEFASNPTWRAAPEPRFAQQSEPPQPVLAMLKVDPQLPAHRAVDPQPEGVSTGLTARESAASAAPAEPEAVVSSVPETERVAVLTTQDASPTETAKANAAPAEVPLASETPAAPTEETTIATAEGAKAPTVDASPAAPETAKAGPADAGVTKSEVAQPEFAVTSSMPATDPAATRIATLGGPPVATEDAGSKNDASERSLEKARLRAQARARARRRLAARARLARLQLAAAQQQPLGVLFGQPPGPTPARTP